MSAILKVVLTPLCVTLLALAVALVFSRKKPALSKSLVLVGFLSILLFSLPIVSHPLILHWEHKVRDISIIDVSPVGTVILLGGGVVEPGRNRKASELGPSGDRLLAAFKLLDKHTGLHIWIADAVDCDICKTQHSSSAKILQSWGVSLNRIFVAPSTTNTDAEILAFKHTVNANLQQPFTLVTSALHMPRTQLLLSKHGLKANLFSANHIVGTKEILPRSLIPTVGSLISSTRTLTEMLAYFYTRYFKI